MRPMPNSLYRARPILLILAIALLAACAGPPEPKRYTIGVLSLVDGLPTLAVFKQVLAEAGYVEGQNTTFIYNGHAGSLEKLPEQVRLLREANVDAIFAMNTPTALEVQRQFADAPVPVVFLIVTNPVSDKLVESQSKPGGMFTGVTQYGGEAKRLEWLRTLAPEAKQVFFPYDSRNPGPKGTLAQLTTVADKLGFELIPHPVQSADELTAALARVPTEADAILTAPDVLIGTQLPALQQIAIERRIPLTVPTLIAVGEPGVLMSYGPDMTRSAQQSARLMVKVLNGARPADIPVETAEFGLRLNLRTARAIGITIGDQYLSQAVEITR